MAIERRKSSAVRKESHLRVRMSRFHKGKIETAADRAGITLSAWVTERLLKAARQETKPRVRQRILTGIDEFDRTIGGGLVPGSMLLLGGFRGTGKTTMAIAVADGVARGTGRKVLYVSGEQSAEDLAREAQRIKRDSFFVEIVANPKDVEWVFKCADTIKPALIVFDSLQSLTSETSNRPKGSSQQAIAVTEAIIDYCRKAEIPSIALCGTNKNGTLRCGGNEYAVDTVVVLTHREPTDIYFALEDPGIVRKLVLDRNRNGRSDLKSYWRMTEAGLVPCES